MRRLVPVLRFFFFNDTATTEIYTLSLHDALPILARGGRFHDVEEPEQQEGEGEHRRRQWEQEHRERQDRKSTRLNSSHLVISYAVFCLKKKKTSDWSPTVVQTTRVSITRLGSPRY